MHMRRRMAGLFAFNSWTLAVRGTVAILCGLAAFFLPAETLFALTMLFGAYALLSGILNLIAAFGSVRHGEHWREFLFEGIIGLAAAALTVIWPGATLVAVLYIIAAWAIVTGVFEILAAVRLRRHIAGEWLLALAGLVSVAFGLLLFSFPGAGALALVWWMGAYVFVFGVLVLSLAFRLRQWSTGPTIYNIPGISLERLHSSR